MKGAERSRGSDAADAVRLDKWLWAARFYKTRSLAAEAIDGGKVQINGVRVKRSRPVGVGDMLGIRKPPYEFTIRVLGLSEHRGPAKTAQQLYEETDESLGERERLRLEMKLQPTVSYEGKGRPTKKERREIDRFKGR